VKRMRDWYASIPPGAMFSLQSHEMFELLAWLDSPKPAAKAEPLTCPHCLEPLKESDGVEGPGGNLWHQVCLESWSEE